MGKGLVPHTEYYCSGDLSSARVLVIGHDPRLQVSDTLAGTAFFGDYYARAVPGHRGERTKYRLAEAVYDYIGHLTSHRFTAGQIVLTNLCNAALPHAPKGKTVYIPEEMALRGIDEIGDILRRSAVELIFAMSVQVNYWLQKLDFYPAVPEFLAAAEPRARGVHHVPPYFEPQRGRSFTLICGNRYSTQDGRSVYPILHVKNWPLKGPFERAYGLAYENCVNALKDKRQSK